MKKYTISGETERVIIQADNDIEAVYEAAKEVGEWLEDGWFNGFPECYHIYEEDDFEPFLWVEGFEAGEPFGHSFKLKNIMDNFFCEEKADESYL